MLDPVCLISKRTGITRRSIICGRWLPIPGQEIVETVCFVAVDHALEDILEIGERLDVVELCRGDERADSGPSGRVRGNQLELVRRTP